MTITTAVSAHRFPAPPLPREPFGRAGLDSDADHAGSEAPDDLRDAVVAEAAGVSCPDQAALLRRIEAGVLADAALAGEFPVPAGASAVELQFIADDGRRAQQVLIDHHVGLARWVASAAVGRTGLDRDEMMQEAMLALVESIPRFDPARGNFATCALPRIRMRVWDAAATALGTLGLPARRARQWRHVRTVTARLMTRLGREPGLDEIAEEAGETRATVEMLLSFDAPVPLEPDLHASGTGADAGGADPMVLRRLLRRLPPFDRFVICHLYGVGGRPTRTYADLAAQTGRSESTIRRRHRAALTLMRAGNAADLLAA
ncbi:MAG: sigma factor [Propioniciclava sp.]|uniref:sigma-70 family RNA polymerase sigma factor n=1 Tax=Propioniciclava sp. TaxID=2038686 RepID=UPI0039E4594D